MAPRGGGGGGRFNGGGRGRGRGRGGGGRGRGRGRGRGGGGGGRDNRWNDSPRSEIKRTNEVFEEYYNRQNILPEDERETFWTSMREDLPNSFRFAGSRGHALTVQRRLIDHYIPQITAVEFEGEPVSPPAPVEWFPDKLAWEMKTPKKVIRKYPPFASFQKFLVSENNVGNITRQEIVSMIPPLLLDIKPGMTVLDLCAAPGSKSAQIIEMVHGGEEARVRKVRKEIAKQEGEKLGPEGFEVEVEKEQAAQEDDYSDDGRSTGLLVANDVDYRRAQMLVHQCKRLNSPNLIVVNHDATLFPSIKIPSTTGNAYLKFDRVLADVPCSGDGTVRKNPEIWKEWAPSKSLGLHTTQVRILVRSLQMLKVGGRVVYSTCSMNPIENEAVIASAIDRCGGIEKVKLVDRSEALPGLKRRPGLTTWKVLDKSGDWWSSYKEMTRTREEKGIEIASKVVEGMFPPDASQNIPLERCMRVYPHMQDTGGFFITVLEKQTEIKARPEKEQKAQPATGTAPDDAAPKGSALAIADEISQRPQNGEMDLDKVEAADDLDAAQLESPMLQSSPAKAGTDETASYGSKRPLDDPDPTGEGSHAGKRMKTRNDEPDNDGLGSSLDRTVHYPPPPTASAHPTADQPNPEQSTADLDADVTGESSAAPAKPAPAHPTKANRNTHGAAEESFIYLSPDHPELLEASQFYHLSRRFPLDRCMVRNPAGEPVKAIYYTSALAKDILQSNVDTGMKFVHCGVKMFVKQDISTLSNAGLGDKVSKWRIQSEGLPILEGWVGKERCVKVWKRGTLRKLLLEMFPKIEDEDGGSDAQNHLGELKEQLKNLGPGCAVLRVEPRGAAGDANGTAAAEGESKPSGEEADNAYFTETLTLPLWRGATSVNLMLPKEERKAMLLRLYNDDTELVDNSKGAQERAMHKARKDAQNVKGEWRGEGRAEANGRREFGGRGPRGNGVPKDATYANPNASGGDFARTKAENEDLGDGLGPTLAEIEAAESAPSSPEPDVKSEDGGVTLGGAQEAEAAVFKGQDLLDKLDNAIDAAEQDGAEKRGELNSHGEDTTFNKTV